MIKVNKKDRILKIFIDAAKHQVINYGIENVSVRKVAEDTGYSYATIYNYFSDLNELLWAVKKEIIQDLIQWMSKMKTHDYDLDGVKQIFHLYIQYYFEYPNIFKFFYFHSVTPTEGTLEDTIDFDSMWINTFSQLMKSHHLSLDDITTISKALIYVIHGALTLHFSQNNHLTYTSLCDEIDQILDYLVQKKGVL